MSPDPVRVLVLYSHPLMGEGLSGMLSAEPGMVVQIVDIAAADQVNAALESEPAVIVIEEGGPVDAAEVVRRCGASLVLDVDIGTANAYTLRRERLSTRPDDFLATIRQAVASATRPEPDAGLHATAVSG